MRSVRRERDIELASENASEYFVDVGELTVQRKGQVELCGIQAGFDFGVGGDGGAEIALFFPAFHGLCLH